MAENKHSRVSLVNARVRKLNQLHTPLRLAEYVKYIPRHVCGGMYFYHPNSFEWGVSCAQQLALSVGQNLSTAQTWDVTKIRDNISYGVVTKWLTFLNAVSNNLETQYKNSSDSGNLAENTTFHTLLNIISKARPRQIHSREISYPFKKRIYAFSETTGRAVPAKSEISRGCTTLIGG